MKARAQPQRSFGDWLRQRRQSLDLSYEELARQVACSAVTLRKLEAEERRPSKQMAERLSTVLQVAVEDRPAFVRFARGDPFAAPPEAGLYPGRPPLKLPAGPRHNLPLQLTGFYGREDDIARVRGTLADRRLVTLTGSGGVGKTRLALRIAEEMLADFSDGVWMVELAPIAEPGRVPRTVAQALGLNGKIAPDSTSGDQSGRDALSLVVDHLRDKNLLLILDNCEHLVVSCSELAEQLLRAAPVLRILATSREALGVAGENSYPVPALSVPNPSQLSPLETLARSDAVRLFVERARSVRPDFALTDENAPAVAQICQRLDGIPLALELAAARVRALTAKQIAAHLAERDRLRLLTGGSRTSPPRQQTLRATIDWSYELLMEAERALLRRLSVFAGGWTLESAEHMLAGPEVLDLLTQLVGKSLVLSTQPPRQEARFSMLETIREYAMEKLVEAGETESALARHLAYYLALAEEAEPELRGSAQVNWLIRLDRENDNLRGALAWALKTGDAESALRMAGALTYFWIIRGYQAEGRGLLDAALNLATTRGSPGPSAWQARALMGAGWMGVEKDLSTSQSRLEKALDMYRELGDSAGMAHALFWFGRHRIAAEKDFTRAFEYYQEALGLWMAAEDGWGVATCLHFMGHAAEELGDRARARELYGRGIEKTREAGDRWQLIRLLGDLARHSWQDGDAARARGMLEESLAIFEELGSSWGISWTLGLVHSISTAQGDYAQASVAARAIQNLPGSRRSLADAQVRLGQIDYLQGRLAEAQAHFEAGLHIFQEQSDETWMASIPPWLGRVAYRSGDLEQARALADEGLAINDSNGRWLELAFALLVRGDVSRAQGEPAAAADDYTRSLRLILKHAHQPDVAERLEGFAKLAGLAHPPQRAARLFGAARAMRDRIGTPVPPVEQADYDAALARTRAQLDPHVFGAAWAQGLALNWEQAAAYALET